MRLKSESAFTALAWVACACAGVMMVTTATDVLLRYFFNRPIPGAFEITEITMGLMVFFALPLMVRRRENIVVNVVFDLAPVAVQRLLTVVTDLACAAVCTLIAWRMWLYGARLSRFNEVTMELAVSKGLIAQTMAVLMGLTALAFLLCGLEAARRGVLRRDALADPS